MFELKVWFWTKLKCVVDWTKSSSSLSETVLISSEWYPVLVFTYRSRETDPKSLNTSTINVVVWSVLTFIVSWGIYKCSEDPITCTLNLDGRTEEERQSPYLTGEVIEQPKSLYPLSSEELDLTDQFRTDFRRNHRSTNPRVTRRYEGICSVNFCLEGASNRNLRLVLRPFMRVG